MRRALVIAASAALLWTAAGCGEKPTVTVYKQGQYRGKPDSQPWGNPAFKNDQAAWETAVKTRNLGQNEYVRIAQ